MLFQSSDSKSQQLNACLCIELKLFASLGKWPLFKLFKASNLYSPASSPPFATIRYLVTTILIPPSIIYTPFSIALYLSTKLSDAIPKPSSPHLLSSSCCSHFALWQLGFVISRCWRKGKDTWNIIARLLGHMAHVPWFFLSWKPLTLNKTAEENFCLDRGVRQVPWTKWPRRGRCTTFVLCKFDF